MPDKDPYNWKHLGFYLLTFLLSIGGSMAKHASLWQAGRAKFTLAEVSAQFIIGSFTGSMVTLYLSNKGFDTEIILIGAGLGGFWGATLLYFVANLAIKRVDPDAEPLKEPKKKERGQDEN